MNGPVQKLCRGHGLTPYDALYVELAISLQCHETGEGQGARVSSADKPNTRRRMAGLASRKVVDTGGHQALAAGGDRFLNLFSDLFVSNPKDLYRVEPGVPLRESIGRHSSQEFGFEETGECEDEPFTRFHSDLVQRDR